MSDEIADIISNMYQALRAGPPDTRTLTNDEGWCWSCMQTMTVRDDLRRVTRAAIDQWHIHTDPADYDGPGLDEAIADAVLAWLMSADHPWVRGSEPHMDGSHTVTVAKYPDRPGTVGVRVPAGYVLVRVWP